MTPQHAPFCLPITDEATYNAEVTIERTHTCDTNEKTKRNSHLEKG